MAKRTKKVGTAGRFQARYGVKARSRVKNIEQHQKKYHLCPNCGHQKVKRQSTGIWKCRKCNTIFAGGAYMPSTPSGIEAEKDLKSITRGT